jgi:hypothetical protein
MNYYPNGYNNYQMNNSYQVPGPFYMKAQEKKRLSFIGVACGSAVVLFSALGAVLGLLLSRFPTFVNEYYNNSAFANAFNMLTTFLLIGGSFLFAYILLKRKGYSG